MSPAQQRSIMNTVLDAISFIKIIGPDQTGAVDGFSPLSSLGTSLMGIKHIGPNNENVGSDVWFLGAGHISRQWGDGDNYTS